MRGLVYIACLFVTTLAYSQSGVDRIRVFRLKSNDLPNNHHGIQPAIRYEKPTVDSTKTWFSVKDEQRPYFILPTSESYFSFDTAINFRATIGANFEQTWGKWYNRTAITSGWSMRENHTHSHPAFSPLHSHQGFIYTDFRTRFAYTPNEQLHISAGIDNQFFGEGYRSLIQADQVAPNPFVQIRASFWNLEYGLLYQFLHENNVGKQQLDWKYNTTHYLSWNVTKNWNLSLFESIVFQGKDSTYKRGYEIEYLNPFVFFRPQEYSLGSTDNMLLGLQSTIYYLGKKHAIYFQLPLDEFVLKEITKRTKWWANKYGLQLGFKGKFEKWNYLIEGNIVRPYTFSHISSSQNTGNMGRPIGHYLGSNFAEILANIQIPLQKIKINVFSSFVLKGFDENGLSYGGDLYQSYTTHPKEYGNTIGQGLTQRFIHIQASVSTVLTKIQMELYLQGGMQHSWGEITSRTIPALSIGIRNNLFIERKIQ